MPDDITKIKIKRTTKSWDQLQSNVLDYGEPLLIKGNEAATSYLTVGEGKSSIASEEVIPLIPKSRADQVLFYDGDDFTYRDGSSAGYSPAGISTITFADGTIYTGTSAITVTATTVGAIASGDSPTVSSPETTETTDNRIATVKYVRDMLRDPNWTGYPVETSLPSSGPLHWNTEYRLGQRSGNLAFTLPTPTAAGSGDGVNVTNEIRVSFLDNGVSGLTIQCQTSNMVIKGIDSLDTNFNTGDYCELSFCVLGSFISNGTTKYLISCLYNTISNAAI